MNSIFYFLVAIITLCYVWIKHRFSFWSRKNILQVNGSFPFGSLKGLGTTATSFEIFDEFYNKYKNKAHFIGIYTFLTPNLLIFHPELIKNVLVREFSSFNHRGLYSNKPDDPTSSNLVTLEGAEWRERRTKLTPIFTSGKMKMMFELFNVNGDKLVRAVERAIKQSNTMDLKEWSQRYTADNIGNTAFGLECNCLEDKNSEFLKFGNRIFDMTTFEVIKFAFSVVNENLARKLHIRLSPKEVSDFFMKTMYDTFDYRERNNVVRNDFVSLLLGLKESFTKEELASEGMLTFTAGYETSSTLMSFTFYELALNQDIQEKLREEILQAVQYNDGKVGYELLNSLKYLDMVTKEVLRKFPPIAINSRKCTKDFQVPDSDFIITEGTTVNINVFSLQRDAEYFPDPLKFDPERFNDENVKNIKPFTYLPFGDGPRNCIGMRFGLMQAKLAIIKLLMNFKFSPCARTPIPMKFKPSAPFLMPVDGIFLKVERI